MDTNRPGDWLRAVNRPLRASFREVVLVSFFVNILTLALPVFILQVYDRVVMHNGLTTLYALVIGVLIAICFDFLLRQTRVRMLQWAAVRVDARLGERVFDKIMSLPLLELERRPASEWQVLFRDVDTIRNTVCGPTAVLAVDLPFIVLFIGLIYVIAAPIAWILVAAIPCFLLLAWRSGRVLADATFDERKAIINRDALISEVLAARGTIKALALERAFRPRWEDRHAAGIGLSHDRGHHSDGFVNMGVILAAVTTVAMTGFGALAILDQSLTIGALIAANMVSNRVIGPLNQLVGSWRYYAHYRQAKRRLDELFAIAGERQQEGIEMERPAGELTLEDVSFHYDPRQPPVIRDVGLHIKPGGIMVGVVGRNGSGKTTLLKLILGLYPPTSGRVLIDGGDVSQFTRRQIADWIGYVPQEARLFKGSIRDNIAVTHPDCGDDEVLAAARLAGVHEYVVNLPDGYDTDVGEGGDRLSGGERQRVAIARALLRDPSILLLDEATSNLDQAAQVALSQTLVKLAEDHTLIVVSHSPALLSMCRSLIVLDQGAVRLAGPADEVLPKLFGGARAMGGGGGEAAGAEEAGGPRETGA